MPRITRPPTARAHPYDVHKGVYMMMEWVASLPSKTGRSLEEWLRLIERQGPASEEQRRAWLKQEQKLGTNTAWWLAERSVGKGGEDDSPEAYLAAAQTYVAEMFGGKKAALRPILDRVVELARGLGRDIQVCPCKTIVPIYRRNVIAQVKPSTLTRVDLGLALGDLSATGRLIDTGGLAKKDRITHRIPLTSARDVDTEVKQWLKRAYDRDAG
ncbi:MAG TPA: DUF5655 domain-containing protein [Gemmatales bacterium]|nr:DUF5655 domain-containing protein [Gemmatales bacterium]HMP59242.1 DUF5655 domain-containing protein [Gemmatales bacterium]